MHSIKFFREHADLIKKDLEKRKDTDKIPWIDEILKKDKESRELLSSSQQLRHSRNSLSEEVNKLRKEGKEFSEKLAEAKEIPSKIKKIEETIAQLQNDIREKQLRIPNILHESVPYGEGEEGNVVLKEVGEKKVPNFPLMNHGEWLEKKNQADFKRSVNISGSGFYALKDKIALLDLSLQRFAIDNLIQKGFTLIQPPYMMRREPYEGVTDLEAFDNVMYKIDEDDLYLIATSEHAIGGMHMKETFSEEQLPLKYVGVSPCFRREIGSHGLDTRGLFRVHQFNKVEQFVFSTPEQSWNIFEELLTNAEELFKALELPYRIVNICTGDIGIVAAKKYDLEVWMPREKKYREVVSCSNCTAYQATRLSIKYKKGEEKHFAHTLNSTAFATSRVIRAIIENFQQQDGTVVIPKALRPYMGGVENI